MKTINKIFLMLALICIAAMSSFAQDKAGTTSMQFLEVMPVARATAMGEAYAAVASGAEAIFYNPAGLAWADHQELSLTYVNWIFDAKLYDLSYAVPVGSLGVFGLQLQYVDYGDFDEAIAYGSSYFPGQTLPYLTGRTFRPYDILAGVSYAKKLTDRFSFGLTAKYAYESLYDKDFYSVDGSGTAYSGDANRGVMLFDAGFRYNTGYRTIQIGASAQNFGSDIKYTTTDGTYSYPAPLELRMGICGDLIGNNALLVQSSKNRFGLAFDVFLSNDATQQEHLGVEYEFEGIFALRAGYKFNYSTEGFVCGGGVRQTIGNMRLSVDYSFGAMDRMISDYTGNVHRISLGVGIQ